MIEEGSNFDNFLLGYLEKKYQAQKNSSLYECAALVLQRLWQGSVCVSVKDLRNEIPHIDIACLEHSSAVGRGDEIRPLIFDGKNLYIQKYYVYQKRIVEKIEELAENNKFHIITGGPGTGKTTSLADILKSRLTEKILLAAPTGKAAARMKESLSNQGIESDAKTIHRLLGYVPLSVNFRRNRDDPLDADIIAVDECSMVDLPMMSKLLDAVPGSCDVYLLGDKHQLASVEAGSVFADICEKYKHDSRVYTELRKNWRAGDAPGILDLSGRILEGNVETFNNDNVHYVESADPCGELSVRYKDLFSAQSPREALDFLKTFQILCALKTGKNGTEQINRKFTEIAKKNNAEFIPIIVTENSYQQNLFNGDTGVRRKDTAYFYTGKNEIKEFPVLTLPEYESAFAITIHKSQGSEYNCAAVVYPGREREESDQTILTRELLYTAVTRARRECLIFGNVEVLKNSLLKRIFRASGINAGRGLPF